MSQKTKGHWPKGKRRNKDAGTWSRIRLSLTHLLTAEWSVGVRTKAAAARSIGVDPRTIGRWMDGTDVPDVDTQAIVRTWCAEQITTLKSQCGSPHAKQGIAR